LGLNWLKYCSQNYDNVLHGMLFEYNMRVDKCPSDKVQDCPSTGYLYQCKSSS